MPQSSWAVSLVSVFPCISIACVRTHSISLIFFSSYVLFTLYVCIWWVCVRWEWYVPIKCDDHFSKIVRSCWFLCKLQWLFWYDILSKKDTEVCTMRIVCETLFCLIRSNLFIEIIICISSMKDIFFFVLQTNRIIFAPNENESEIMNKKEMARINTTKMKPIANAQNRILYENFCIQIEDYARCVINSLRRNQFYWCLKMRRWRVFFVSLLWLLYLSSFIIANKMNLCAGNYHSNNRWWRELCIRRTSTKNRVED